MNIHELIRCGDMAGLRAALAAGADVHAPGHCDATSLMTAIAHENRPAFDLLLQHGADPERTNCFNYTALHVAVEQDWPEAVAHLISLGVDLGYNPKHPLKQVDYGDVTTDLRIPKEIVDPVSAKQWRESQRESLEKLLELNKPPEPHPVIKDVQSVAVLQLLIDAGEVLEDAPVEVRRQYVGLPAQAELACQRHDYELDCQPRPGTANPERLRSPYMEAMIHCGGSADVARRLFDNKDLSKPVWSYDRFGHSLTRLDDGRFVGIAGEHEDSYDPDFCIYNDVFIHDGAGGVELFLYPHEIFPPTDFHSATLVDGSIFIIGNLGYAHMRCPGTTPVYRLDLSTMAIAPLATHGESPGWLSRHRAIYDRSAGGIRIWRGKRWDIGPDGTEDLIDNHNRYLLTLNDMRWHRES